jgi:ribose transport system ATP-binding protein
MNANVLQIRNLEKSFPGVKALDDVSFNIKRNTVHCLVGENGAGKSTLIKILTGVLNKTSGTILLNDKELSLRNTSDAKRFGIATLYQELNIVEQLTIEENLTLGVEDTKFGFLQKTDKSQKMITVLKNIEPSLDSRMTVSTLSTAKRQLVEIARAVGSDAEIVIMDEPTAAISEKETQRLFHIIKNLKQKNVTVIYISHRLDEIFEIGDYVSVLRDGKHIDTKPVSDVKNRSELIKMMLGKTVYEKYIPKETQSKENILEAKNISNSKLKNISFEVKKGEIVGFYGLVGSGKTEIARALIGADEFEGKVILNGKRIVSKVPKDMIKAGVALVPEERRTQGLFTILPIRENIPVMNLKKISSKGIINKKSELKYANNYINQIKIATHSTEKEVALLSGGNQQKVVFAKCLFADSDLLMLDEPSRGVDVGAKEEIHNIIRQLSNDGTSIIIFSSELSEIVNLSDRIYLLYDGELKSEIINGVDIDSENIIHVVTGGE